MATHAISLAWNHAALPHEWHHVAERTQYTGRRPGFRLSLHSSETRVTWWTSCTWDARQQQRVQPSPTLESSFCFNGESNLTTLNSQSEMYFMPFNFFPSYFKCSHQFVNYSINLFPEISEKSWFVKQGLNLNASYSLRTSTLCWTLGNRSSL